MRAYGVRTVKNAGYGQFRAQKLWLVKCTYLKRGSVQALRSLVRAEVSGGRGADGGGVGGGNDLRGGLGEEAVQGLRPGRRIVGLGCDWGAVD